MRSSRGEIVLDGVAWCSEWYIPLVVESDEIPVRISGFNEAVLPRSSLGKILSVQETMIHSVSQSTLLSTHWWGLEGILSALGNKGKLGMTDPCPYRDHRLIGETNGLFPGVR